MTPIHPTAGLRVGITRNALTWYCYLSLGYITYLISIQGNILPFLQAELGLGYGAASLHTSAIAAGLVVIGLFGDRLTRRHGRRTMLLVGILGAAAAALAFALAPAAWATITCCVFIGLSTAFIPSIVPAVFADTYGPQSDIAITESNATAYAFAVLAPLIAGTAAAFAWNWRVVPLAGVAMGIIIACVFFRARVPDSDGRSVPDSGVRLAPAFWAYWAMLGFAVAVEFSALLWAPAFLERVVGMSAGAAALGAAAFFSAMLVGRTVGIGLVRAFDGRRIFLVAAVTTLVGFAAYWSTGWPPAALGGLFVVGLGVSLLFPLALSFAMESAGDAPDRAATRTMLAPGLAILVSPPLLGAIADRFSLAAAQFATPVFMLMAVGAFLVAERLRRDYSASSS